MPKFKLFAGLGGGFGGPEYYDTCEYRNREEAMQDAYQLAIEQYQSYEGCHGIMSWGDVYEDLKDSGYFDTIDGHQITPIRFTLSAYDDNVYIPKFS